MHLDDQIAQITNPQEFTRLCNVVFTAKYGTDFQIIDGTRSDEGNDGYIVPEERIVAIHCPIKPEKKTDKDYLAKIKSDLEKAYQLNRSGKFAVKNWTFITPRKLSNQVVSEMFAEAERYGVRASHLESTYLANVFYEHKELIEAFPYLHRVDIEAKLNEILKRLPEEPLKEATQSSDVGPNNVYRSDTINNDDFDKVVEIRRNNDPEQSKIELRGILYRSIDPVVQLNAILGILDICNVYEDEGGDLIELCERGIGIAKGLENESLIAYFLAQKGLVLSMMYAYIDLRTAAEIRMQKAIGISTITEASRQEVLGKLRRIKEDYTQAFSEALDLLVANNDLYTLASTLIIIGNAACQRAIHLPAFGALDQAKAEKLVCKRALLSSKDLYARAEDELGVAYAIFNLANNIRFMGEEKEALELVKGVLKTAREYDDKSLLKRATWLEESLITGKIPDYVHGERRE